MYQKINMEEIFMKNESKRKVYMEEIFMKNESERLEVHVTGGMLIAEKAMDPDYPGISISFVPDCGGGNTELALMEEADKRLVLRSWMDLSREDPDSYYCSYDDVLLSQVSYGIYLERCHIEKEVPMSAQYFAENFFYDRDYMKNLLPENLFQKYESVIARENNTDEEA